MTYDDINRFVRDTATVGANLHKVETYFDKFYRTFKIVGYDPAGNVQADTLYDASGRVSAVSEPYRTGSPAWTSTAYDAVDRPVTVTKPDGSVFQYSYPYAYSINETDEAGNGKVTSFATTGEIDGVNDGILTTTYQHSMFGPLSVHQDGQWRTFTYDWLGRQASASHPESGTTSYGYDVAGRMTSRTDARGVTASTTYDVIDRPLVTCYSDATPTVTRTYDQNGYVGFLTTIVDGTGTTTFTYNSAGQLASESRTFNGVSGTFTTAYGYDLDGKLQSITYPSGRVVAYSYQSGGGLATSRLNSIVDQSMDRTIVNNVEDNAAGQITSQTLGNGVVETRIFNNRSQLTGIVATHGGSGLLNLSFGHGNPVQNDGRIRSRIDALQPEHSVQYSFDSGGRLTQAVNDSWSVSWGYDVLGNRLTQSPTGLATSRVGTQTLGYWDNRNASFSYDAAGNVLNDTVHNYAYDGESRMVQGDGGAIVYGYDFAGRRVKRTVGGQTTYYLYGIRGLLSEFTTADTGVTGWSANDRTRYIVSDQTGTPVLAIAQDGLVEENNRVFPFGESWLWETGTPFDPQFTSYLRDDETGLDYAMARNYASRGGRFVTSDPGHVGGNVLDPQSWNAYAYARNDPVNLVDPTGLKYNLCIDRARPIGRLLAGDEKENGCQELTDDQFNRYRSFFQNLDLPYLNYNQAGRITCVFGGRETEDCGWVYRHPEPGNLVPATDLISVGIDVAVGAGGTAVVKGLTGKVGKSVVTASAGTGLVKDAFHYTFKEFVESIMVKGLKPGTFVTPNGSLSPLQAQLELAMPWKGSLPSAMLQIDLKGLRSAGFEIPPITRVRAWYGMPGGGYEMEFPYEIPARFITRIK